MDFISPIIFNIQAQAFDWNLVFTFLMMTTLNHQSEGEGLDLGPPLLPDLQKTTELVLHPQLQD